MDALTLADRTVLIDEGRVIQAGARRRSSTLRRRQPRRVGIDTILLGRIASVDNGLARVMVGTQEVRAAAPAGAGHEAALCIRAEDVTIALHDLDDPSTINRWRAVVRTEDPKVRSA